MNIDVQLRDMISEAVSAEHDRRLVNPGASRDELAALKDDNTAVTPEQVRSAVLRLWCNDGFTRDIDPQHFVNDPKERDKFRMTLPKVIKMVDQACAKIDRSKLQDNIGVPTNAGMLIPQIITQIVRESVDPIMVGTSLLRRINYSNGTTIEFPAVGAYNAADLAPGQEYPEKSLEYAGVVHAKIGKVGVKLRILDEMIRYSLFDVMSLHMRAAARAMARHKETRIFTMINALGVAGFDNAGGPSLHGRTTGRDRTGLPNGTITLDDLFTMYADLMNAGFIPNTLIMNPMGWLVFVLNGALRAFGFANNGPLWGSWQGRPGQAPTFGRGGVNMGPAAGPPASATPAEMSNSNLQGNVPSIFPAPLDIVVSPFVAFSAAGQTTTITMADRNELGFLIVDEELVTETWDDPARDIRSTKFRERYAVAIDNEGNAVINAKCVRIAKGYDFEDFQVTFPIGTGVLPTGTGLDLSCDTAQGTLCPV